MQYSFRWNVSEVVWIGEKQNMSSKEILKKKNGKNKKSRREQIEGQEKGQDQEEVL